MVGLWVWWPLLILCFHCHAYFFISFVYFIYFVQGVLIGNILYLLFMWIFERLLLLLCNYFRCVFWRLLSNKCVKTLRILVWWDRWNNAVTSLLIYFYDVFVYYWCPNQSIRLFIWLDRKTISMWLLFDLHFIWIILFFELTLIDNLSRPNLIKFLIWKAF